MKQYYQRFTANYSNIAEPLDELKCKLTRFACSEQMHKAYKKLKYGLIRTPVLALRDDIKITQAVADASFCGLEAMLALKSRVISYAH